MHSFAAIQAPKDTAQAIERQQTMRRQVILNDHIASLNLIAGIDVGYDVKNNISKAAIVLMDWTTLQVTETVIAHDETPFPYIPGLLSFREAPVILKALQQLSATPDILFIDGQGIAHPRRLGIASHVGVLTDIPSVGVAKSVLCGRYQDPANVKGAMSPLIHKGEIIGTVCRSRINVRPIFISPGHKVSHETSVSLTMRCLSRYRLPEPTRLADKLSKFTPDLTSGATPVL